MLIDEFNFEFYRNRSRVVGRRRRHFVEMVVFNAGLVCTCTVLFLPAGQILPGS